MSVVALWREHASIITAPVLREVDTRIFGLRYFTLCMACGFCNDQCCSYGVDIDFDNAQELRGLGEGFRNFVGVPEEDWFTGELVEDVVFLFGCYTRTQTRGSHCVFHKK